MSLINSIYTDTKSLSINVEFRNSELSQNRFTLLIGPNGSGKSRILTEIVSMSSYESSGQENGSYPSRSNLFTTLPLQNLKFVTFSNNPSDKFPIKKPKSKSKGPSSAEYTYIGTKTNNNRMSFRLKFLNLMSEIAIELHTNPQKNNEYHEILKDLGFKSKILLTVFLNPIKKLFDEKFGPEIWDEVRDATYVIEKLNEKYKKNIFDESEAEIVKKFLLRNLDKIVKENFELNYELDFNSRMKSDEFSEDSKAILILRRKKIISIKELGLWKTNSNLSQPFSLWNASSGETLMIYLLFSILYHIRDGAIFLLDEPENSLHPNWQIDLIPLIKKRTFSTNSYQFIIATHSPQIVANSPADETSVISCKQEDSVISGRQLHSNYWSVESILYNVFGTSEAGNKFFERDLQSLLHLLSSKSKNRNELQRLITDLSQLQLKQNDPVKTILSQATAYLNSI